MPPSYAVRQAQRTQNTPKFGVVMHMARIQIVSDRALKHGRILGDDGQTASQIEQTNSGHVQPIDTRGGGIRSVLGSRLMLRQRFSPDVPPSRLNDTEECQC